MSATELHIAAFHSVLGIRIEPGAKVFLYVEPRCPAAALCEWVQTSLLCRFSPKVVDPSAVVEMRVCGHPFSEAKRNREAFEFEAMADAMRKVGTAADRTAVLAGRFFECLNDLGEVVEVLDSHDSCHPHEPNDRCGGCGECLLQQAHYYGAAVRPASDAMSKAVVREILRKAHRREHHNWRRFEDAVADAAEVILREEPPE